MRTQTTADFKLFRVTLTTGETLRISAPSPQRARIRADRWCRDNRPGQGTAIVKEV
jgi:hypothetical protein